MIGLVRKNFIGLLNSWEYMSPTEAVSLNVNLDFQMATKNARHETSDRQHKKWSAPHRSNRSKECLLDFRFIKEKLGRESVIWVCFGGAPLRLSSAFSITHGIFSCQFIHSFIARGEIMFHACFSTKISIFLHNFSFCSNAFYLHKLCLM